MSAVVDGALTAVELVERWEDQQAAYITRREERFDVMLDVLAHAVPADARVLDLACGPGSISARVVQRFPGMCCTGVDHDPALLLLAQRAAAERGTDGRSRFADADLLDPAWPAVLGDDRPHAVLTSTALHWLAAPALVSLYAALADLLPPGGVLLNADHLRGDTERALFTDLAARDDEATQEAAWARGVDTWDTWFARLAGDPTYAGAVVERGRRFADRPPNPQLGLGFHVEALRAAGFAEVGPLWQHLDDYVVLARR